MLKQLSTLLKRKFIVGYLASLKFRKRINAYVDYSNAGMGYVRVLYKHSYLEDGRYRVAIHCSRCDSITTLPTTSLAQQSCGCMGRGRPRLYA